MSSTSESITMAKVAAVPTSSRLASDIAPASRATSSSSPALQPMVRDSEGSGAETMPLTWPIRSWVCGSATMMRKRKSDGTTARMPETNPSFGR